MNIGSTYAQTGTQSVYAPKRNSAASFANEGMGISGDRTKTMRLKNKFGEQIITFDPYTLEVDKISTPKDEKDHDPVYLKLKAAGLIDDDEEKANEKAKGFDESLLDAVRWHYVDLYAMKKAWETVVKIEEDQMEEIFDRLEHNTGEELSTEGVTEGAASGTDETLNVVEDQGAEQNGGIQSDY